MVAERFPDSSPNVFSWGHVFQRGDLPLYMADAAGNPIAPARVSYTLLYYPRNGSCCTTIGPEGRTPVQADLGEYYVSGVAGEGGQPGDWSVLWLYQETFDGPEVEVPFHFKVFESSQFHEVPSAGNTPHGHKPCRRF